MCARHTHNVLCFTDLCITPVSLRPSLSRRTRDPRISSSAHGQVRTWPCDISCCSSTCLLSSPYLWFYCVHWAPLWFLLSTAATSLEDHLLPLSAVGTHLLTSWSFQSISSRVFCPLTLHPRGTHTSSLDCPSLAGSQGCLTESFTKDSIFTLSPILLGHRQYSTKAWARKKAIWWTVQITHKSPSPLWGPKD